MIWKNLTKNEMSELTDEIITKWKEVDDRVGNVDLDKVTWENVVVELLRLEEYFDFKKNLVDFPQYVSDDKEVRDVACECSKKFTDQAVESGMRQDVYLRVKKIQEITDLKGEDKKLVNDWIRDWERIGLDKEENEREKIKKILKELSASSIDFNKNLGEENTKLYFTKEELNGTPEDFVAGLELDVETGKYEITLKYPHVFPIAELCNVPETRRIVKTVFDRRCVPVNVEIIEKMIVLRKELSDIMGFETYSDYVLDVKMAKNSKTVKTFLEDLNEKMTKTYLVEKEEYLKLKEKECKELNIDFDGKINAWDFGYYSNKYEEMMCDGLDQEKVKEYFPVSSVTNGILDIYQELLGLNFERVEDTETWHEDVVLYRVNDKETNDLVGYFYLDLYPREGKFAHAAEFGLQKDCITVSGEKQFPVAACVCNFPKPDSNNLKGSCLTHDNVTTFFHEFGHVMHELCSKVKYITMSGTSVERDAVEAPSQMLENWCFVPEILQRLSSHYQDGSLIPVEICDQLKKSKLINVGAYTKRQLMFGMFDQQLHTMNFETEDSKTGFTERIWKDIQEKVMGIEMIPGTNFIGSFGHLAGGYEASYYGYMWSKVYSCDMFSRFEKNPMDSQIGMEYRTKILEKGGTKDFMEYLIDFLGREPNQDAFLKDKGIF